MNSTDYKVIVKCPWCQKGATLADKPADINVSCRCHVCGRVYQANFQTGRSIKTAVKKIG